jgi:hypothetical protein
MKKRALLAPCAVALPLLSSLLACRPDPEERYDVGYDDGYAVGYNTACQIRATLIEGDFDNADYARGYSQGTTDGVMACNADRAAGRTGR